MVIVWTDTDLVFLIKQFRQGRVCLFLGAGFSVDAKNGANGSPPTGSPLAEILAKEAALPYHGESLALSYEASQKQIGRPRMWDLLRKLYDIRSFADWYADVRAITWHRIYTLNIDNLIEKIYQGTSDHGVRRVDSSGQARLHHL